MLQLAKSKRIHLTREVIMHAVNYIYLLPQEEIENFHGARQTNTGDALVERKSSNLGFLFEKQTMDR